ncbi:MAG: CinA family protein [Deltaproteobacteria bacterium]|nr:CinA family protein [Deltaproteobacteria bacterium]
MYLFYLRLANILKNKRLTISTAESCTGGLLAKYLTDVPGSSVYFKMGIVAYSNESKIKLLKVKKSTLRKCGAVSEDTATEMVMGLKKLANTDIAVSITGIAGPGGGSKKRPVGTVFFGLVVKGELYSYKKWFKGNRNDIREKSVRFIVSEIIRKIGG